MSKRGYLILGLLLLGLVAYLVWPQGDADSSTWDLLEARPAGGFTLTSRTHEQQVRGERVTIDGIDRPLDPERVERLWGSLERMAAVHAPIPPAGELAAYGLGPEATRLVAQDLDLRWGIKDDTGWLYDAGDRLLYRFEGRIIAALEDAAGRLDRRALVALSGEPDVVVVTGTRLEAERAPGGGLQAWRFADAADRPPATGRVARLVDWLVARELSSLVGELPAGAAAAFSVALEVGGEVRTVTLHRADDAAWLVADALPPQPLEAAQAARFAELVAAFERDLLYDLPIPEDASPVTSIRVTRGSDEVFEAERGDIGDANPAGESTWELRWAGGREVADADVGRRFLGALLRLPVRDSEARDRRLDALPAAREGVEIVELRGYLPDGVLWLQIDGDRVANPGFEAEAVDLPALLRDLAPGSALSTRLLRAPPERIGRLQRARFEDGRLQAEVLRRGESGWTMVAVRGAPDAPAAATPEPVAEATVRRLAGALILAQAESVRLAEPGDLAIREDPTRRELAVRVEPMTIDKASDIDRVEETAAREWGLALRPLDDGAWEAVDFDGTLRYRLSADLVDEWFAPIASRAVLAIQPSRVERVAVTPPEGRAYDLESAGGGAWSVVVGERRFPADPTSLRAWLGRLARLEARSIDPAGLPLAPEGAGHGLLEIGLPGYGGKAERIQLVVGPGAGETVQASTGSGRMILARGDLATLFPVVGTFLSPEDLQRLDAEPGG